MLPNVSYKVILILPLILLIVQLSQGSAVRKVVYHEGVAEGVESLSSSLEDIPPREEWFRVRETPVAHSPRTLNHGPPDIIVLPSARPVVRNERIQGEITLSADPPLTDEERPGRQMQVHVRNRGKVGFHNDERMKKTDRDQDQSLEEQFPLIRQSETSPSFGNGKKNLYQHVRHENGHRNRQDELVESDENVEKEDRAGYYEDRRTVAIQLESEEAVPVSLSSDDDDYINNDPPPHDEVAKMARYIVRNSNWTSVATISTMSSVRGYPFVNVFSLSDGPINNSTGIPYMYLTPLDISAKDLKNDSRASATMSLAQSDYCTRQQYDPEDPRCAHVILSGRIVRVTNRDEIKFAQNALYSKHPEMKTWPKDHGWFFAKLDIEQIVVLDYFGGAKKVSLDDYFNQYSL